MRLHAIDTSGGISPQMVDDITKRIRANCGPHDPAVCFDTMVFPIGLARKAGRDTPLQGGGGTSAQPVIDWAAKNGCDEVMFYTDGYFIERHMLNDRGLALYATLLLSLRVERKDLDRVRRKPLSYDGKAFTWSNGGFKRRATATLKFSHLDVIGIKAVDTIMLDPPSIDLS